MKGVAGFVGIISVVYIFWVTYEFIQMRKQGKRIDKLNKKSEDLVNNNLKKSKDEKKFK